MTTAPEADLRYLRKWLNERPNSPIDCAALARVLHWAALASKQAEAQAKRDPADLQRIELSDGAWLERGGPLSIWGLYRANTGHLRELNRFEREFIDCTIRAAIAATQEQKP